MGKALIAALSAVLFLGAQEPTGFDALAEEYEQTFDVWVTEMSRTGGFEKPESERPPSPLLAFRPRFEAFAAAGEGRATLWLLANLVPETGPTLLAQVKNGGDAEWVGSALHALGANAAAFPHDDLVAYLDERSEKAGSALLRAYAALALAQVVAGEDSAHAAHLRLSAALLAQQGVALVPGEELAREDVLELSGQLLERVEKEGRAHFALAYRAGSDGMYFPVTAAPPDPEERWRPSIEELALRGSTPAQLWVIANAPWDLDAAGRERLRGFLDAIASAPLPEKEQRGFGYEIGGLVHRLGLATVEPSVRKLIENNPESARPGLLFGLGDAVCEAAGDDATVRDRGLAILREVGEHWPASDEAKRAEGRIFRYTKLVVGNPVPDFETVDADGNAFKLSDYRGKVTVIDFWGFW